MARKTQGRCPDCGAPVLVTITRGSPAEIPPHACGARACEYEGCRVRALMDEMVRFPAGEWYCPSHGLLLAARDSRALVDDQDANALSHKASAHRHRRLVAVARRVLQHIRERALQLSPRHP